MDIQKSKEEANSGAGAAAELIRKSLPTLEKHLSIAEKLDQGS